MCEQTNLEWIRGSLYVIHSSKSFIHTVGWLISVEQLRISCGSSHSFVCFFSCFRFSSYVFSYLCNACIFIFFFRTCDIKNFNMVAFKTVFMGKEEASLAYK